MIIRIIMMGDGGGCGHLLTSLALSPDWSVEWVVGWSDEGVYRSLPLCPGMASPLVAVWHKFNGLHLYYTTAHHASDDGNRHHTYVCMCIVLNVDM